MLPSAVPSAATSADAPPPPGEMCIRDRLKEICAGGGFRLTEETAYYYN